jgi:hypothetical protein
MASEAAQRDPYLKGYANARLSLQQAQENAAQAAAAAAVVVSRPPIPTMRRVLPASQCSKPVSSRHNPSSDSVSSHLPYPGCAAAC